MASRQTLIVGRKDCIYRGAILEFVLGHVALVCSYDLSELLVGNMKVGMKKEKRGMMIWIMTLITNC